MFANTVGKKSVENSLSSSKNDNSLFIIKQFDSNQDLLIRPAQNVDEVSIAMEWAAQEGWNVGKHDAKAYYKAFPSGCRLLLVKEQLVGAIFLANYSKDFVFIGLFVVEKSFRGKGFGKILWEYAMREVEKKISVGLYAVPQQVSRYASSNFKTLNNILRWNAQAPAVTNFSVGANSLNKTLLIEKSNTDLIAQVNEYESKMFPAPRFELIKAMLELPQVVGVAIKESEQIVGYGLIRPCQKGYRIGPLYANSFEAVKALTTKLLEMIAGLNETVVFDTLPPSQNRFITMFAEYFNLQRVNDADTYAMFKGEIPKEIEESFEKTYAACSLELG
jgi:GNAT superfamily N-acetyltransferase